MSAGSPAALPKAAPNLLATARHQSKTNFPSPSRPTRTSVFDGHPMEAKLTYMRDKYLKGKLVDPLAIEYGNFPANLSSKPPKPRMSEWMRKEVMLPILGKNKTSLLHSSAQLDVESIAQQKSCLNRPAKHITDQTDHGPSAPSKRGYGFRALHNTSDTFPDHNHSSKRKETSKTTSPGAPKKLTATLKQQAKNVQNQEKEQERHLMQQIEVVAQLMAIAATKPTVRAESVEPETPMPSQMGIT